MTGEEFAYYRRLRKLTQRQVGQMLGYEGHMAERMVQAYEYNQRRIPLRHIRKLSEILQVPIDKFVP